MPNSSLLQRHIIAGEEMEKMSSRVALKEVDGVEIISLADNTVDFLSTTERKEVHQVREWVKNRMDKEWVKRHFRLPFAEHGFLILVPYCSTQVFTELQERIVKLKKERNAVILAHNYQRGSVQDVADFTGDSFGLSKKAVNTEANIIVFSGVRFMAETASILNPDKKILLPDLYAGCELAEMCTAKELEKEMKKHPSAAVVSYVNSFASIKALSDICCTSSNAVDVVKSLPNKEVLFLPDKNLASFVAERVRDKKIIPWDGYCYVHQDINPDKINNLRRRYPDAVVMVHPECVPKVRETADFVGSTAQMERYVRAAKKDKYIVGTEDGLVYRLRRDNPDKKFYSVGATCVGMKRNTLHDLLFSLEKENYEVRVPERIRIKAKEALDRMLEI